MPEMLKNSEVRINYAFVPPTLPVQAAIVGDDLPLSHIRPIPGGINAILRIRWRATSPILCGNEGKTLTYSCGDRGEKKMKLTEPLRNGAKGRYTLSGTALAGMVRSALKVATGSYYGPINKKYINKFGKDLDRGEYPITSTDINNELRQKKQEAGKDTASERRTTLTGMMADNSNWSTIAQVADRTYCPEGDESVLDWTNAMMGFVLGEVENTEGATRDQWRPNWPEGLRKAFPQGLQSRISIGFADCTIEDPGLWPEADGTVLKVPGAGPKVSFSPSYLAAGRWNTSDARLSGLKVYPVHCPDFHAFCKTEAFFENYTEKERGMSQNAPRESDTLLKFIKASSDNPVDFVGTITCHNLAPVEFGALVWALFLGEAVDETPHEDSRHNIGRLRGYGMGQLVPMLMGADLSINPVPEKENRQEISGREAISKMNALLQEFEKSSIGDTTKAARERLKLFKSRKYGTWMVERKRIKPFSPSNGKDAQKFTRIKKNGCSSLAEQDNRLADEFTSQKL